MNNENLTEDIANLEDDCDDDDDDDCFMCSDQPVTG